VTFEYKPKTVVANLEQVSEALRSFFFLVLAGFLLNSLRGGLLSICCSFLFPAIALSFWQWLLIVYTFRLLIALPVKS
jgi:hypothetical protein